MELKKVFACVLRNKNGFLPEFIRKSFVCLLLLVPLTFCQCVYADDTKSETSTEEFDWKTKAVEAGINIIMGKYKEDKHLIWLDKKFTDQTKTIVDAIKESTLKILDRLKTVLQKPVQWDYDAFLNDSRYYFDQDPVARADTDLPWPGKREYLLNETSGLKSALRDVDEFRITGHTSYLNIFGLELALILDQFGISYFKKDASDNEGRAIVKQSLETFLDELIGTTVTNDLLEYGERMRELSDARFEGFATSGPITQVYSCWAEVPAGGNSGYRWKNLYTYSYSVRASYTFEGETFEKTYYVSHDDWFDHYSCPANPPAWWGQVDWLGSSAHDYATQEYENHKTAEYPAFLKEHYSPSKTLLESWRHVAGLEPRPLIETDYDLLDVAEPQDVIKFKLYVSDDVSGDSIIVPFGQEVTARWIFPYPGDCTIGTETVPVIGSKSFTPQTWSSHTYSVTCSPHTTGLEFTVEATAEVTPPPPELTFTSDKSDGYYGDSVALSWSTQYVESCSATWRAGGLPASGTSEIVLSSSYTAPTITCTGPGGTVSKTLYITGRALDVNFSASPLRVFSGGTVTLTWSAGEATSCSAGGAWSGTKPANGSESFVLVSSRRTNKHYTITCDAPLGSTSKEVLVVVEPSI